MMDFKKSTKKDILYLVEDFLINNGFRETADCFHSEAELSNEYTVCDNISLETIVIEFEIFYHQRFKIRPQLCKAIKCPVKSGGKRRLLRENKKIPAKTIPTESNITQLSADLITFGDSSLKCGDNNNNRTDPGFDATNEESASWKEYHDIILQSVHLQKVDVRWQNVKGVKEVKELLKEAIIYPIKFPHLFTNVVEPWRSILMYGPPGTGKTLLANAVAAESNATFFNISPSLVVNKWRGDSEKLIKVLFELASKKAPSVIFIDEIDALVMKRNSHEHEASRRMKSELFFGIDKILQSNQIVLILAATNVPWDLDAAMLRRFEKHVYVPPPDDETRKLLIEHFLPKIVSAEPIIHTEFDYDFITKKTEKFTGCEIKNICKDIKMILMREIFSNLESRSTKKNSDGQKRGITHEEIENILSKFKPTFVLSEDKYVEWLNDSSHK